MKIDIKAQTNKYINNPIDTFCLELSYKKNGKEYQGWLLNPRYETTHWMWMWIPDAKYKKLASKEHSNRNRKVIESPEDINQYELLIASKKKVVDWLNSKGLDKKKCIEGINYLRQNPSVNKIYYSFKTKEFNDKYGEIWLIATNYSEKSESPINIVIKKEYWFSLCCCDYLITPSASWPYEILKENYKVYNQGGIFYKKNRKTA